MLSLPKLDNPVLEIGSYGFVSKTTKIGTSGL
jgi:hypothetical protein